MNHIKISKKIKDAGLKMKNTPLYRRSDKKSLHQKDFDLKASLKQRPSINYSINWGSRRSQTIRRERKECSTEAKSYINISEPVNAHKSIKTIKNEL
mmetsp:Transcript_24388/g.21635  ORF Transcript_24388/g.21635 Transcript_24388/m.21635 type:complete len:97 (+) Transcript_24388:782-1072(+)